jgi:heptosyltransferase-3
MTAWSMLLFLRVPTLLAKWWRQSAAREPHAPLGLQQKPSFIVYRLDGLGDVVMTTPLFRELKRSFPGSRCTVVVPEAYRPLFATNPCVDEILTMPVIRTKHLPRQGKRLLSALVFCWKHLRRKKFDVCISPRWEVDEHLATFLCLMTDAALRVGYTEKTSAPKRRLNRGFDGAFDLCLPPRPRRHEVLRSLAVVEALGGTVEDMRLDIRLSTRDRQHAAKILQDVPKPALLVALGIGAQSAGRCWPLERFADTIAGLEERFPVQPVIICSPHEYALAGELARHLRIAPLVVSRPQLRHTCAVLERCDLLIGNDSGPAHLAAAMECKTIVISRHPRSGDPDHPNSPIRFAPHCHEWRVVQPAWPLAPCDSGCRSSEPHCITQVSTADVVAAALELLAPHPSHAAQPDPPAWADAAALTVLNTRRYGILTEGRA